MADAAHLRLRLVPLATDSAHLPLSLGNEYDAPSAVATGSSTTTAASVALFDSTASCIGSATLTADAFSPTYAAASCIGSSTTYAISDPIPIYVIAIGGSTTTAAASALFISAAICTGSATMEAPGGAAASTMPGLGAELSAPHSEANRVDAATIARFAEASRQAVELCSPIIEAQTISQALVLATATATRVDNTVVLIAAVADYVASTAITPYDEAERRDIARVLLASHAERVDITAGTGYHEAERRGTTHVFTAANAFRVDRSLIDRWGQGVPRTLDLRIPWGAGQWAPWLVAPPNPTPPTPTPTANGRYIGLNLGCPVQLDGAHLPLLLGSVQCYHVYPRQRTYHVLNSASVVRLPDRTPIAASAINLTIDVDSFSWSVSMDLLDAESLALLTPTVAGPREVEITINGWVWTAIIDSDDETAAWLGNGRRVAGRSRAAYLAAPYAPVRSRVVTDIRLAQQLADIELTDTGWALDWECLDWLVPAGAWTYTDLTPIDAIRRIAESIGAIVQTHRTDDELSVRARYPVKPWDWDSYAPDHIVLPDYTVGRSGTYAGGTRPNAVVVRGERYGIAARVIRAGTAGDVYAGSIVDALMATSSAAQARAICELARVGPIRQVSVEMPLFPSGTGPGLIEPGRVVLMSGPDEYRSFSRACSISVQRTGAQLRVRQVVSVERHLDYA